MKNFDLMKKLFWAALVTAAVACGSTGTDSDDDDGADDDDDDDGAFSCADITAGSGVICDSTTTPPTLKLDFGSGAGKVAEGTDIRLMSPGTYLGYFSNATGQKVASGGLTGVRAADALCKSSTLTGPYPGPHAAAGSYAGAHACSNAELIMNAAAGTIALGENGAALPNHSYVEGAGTIYNRYANCDGWTNSLATGSKGTKWEIVDSDPDNLAEVGKANSIKFTALQDCSVASRVACCR